MSVLGSWPGATPVSASADAVVGASSVTVTIPAAQTKGARLWQPHGHGEQIRYNLSATFAAGAGPPATAWRQIGFRHIALVTVNDSDAAVATAASSQDGTGTFTMFFRVNGAPVYARGGNKIPMELLDGRMTARAHWRLVKSAAEGNFNMLRMWVPMLVAPKWKKANACHTDHRMMWLGADGVVPSLNHARSMTRRTNLELCYTMTCSLQAVVQLAPRWSGRSWSIRFNVSHTILRSLCVPSF
eukprot:SAG31_NODE_1185_length_9494_cov_5.602980_3_plen_243_part_00